METKLNLIVGQSVIAQGVRRITLPHTGMNAFLEVLCAYVLDSAECQVIDSPFNVTDWAFQSSMGVYFSFS